jgi:hypothetical protein
MGKKKFVVFDVHWPAEFFNNAFHSPVIVITAAIVENAF